MVPKMWSVDPKVSATSSEGIRYHFSMCPLPLHKVSATTSPMYPLSLLKVSATTFQAICYHFPRYPLLVRKVSAATSLCIRYLFPKVSVDTLLNGFFMFPFLI